MERDLEQEASCVGLPIKSAMTFFSNILLQGCEKFLDLTQKSNAIEEISIFNSAIVFSAHSFLEAMLNETISLNLNDNGNEPGTREPWLALQKIQKKITVQEKWDLIASISGGSPWDSSQEPFQSYELISSLRNELVHFKGEFHGPGEAPNKKIKGLVNSLGVKTNAEWKDDDFSTWLETLMSSKDLSKWVYEKISLFNTQYHPLLLRQ